jgi:hypothetical protein
LFPLFATDDTSNNLPPVPVTPAANLPLVSLTPVENLPLVSTTPAVPVAKFAAGVVDTGGKFTTGTGGAVHLHLRISPRILEKVKMTLMLFSGAWGRMIHKKNLTQKIL